MLSFRENNPYFSTYRKEQKVPLGVVTEEKPRKHRKGTGKKIGPRLTNTLIKMKGKVKSGAKTNQKIKAADVFSIGGDSGSLNSNMKRKSSSFLMQLNSRNKRYNG